MWYKEALRAARPAVLASALLASSHSVMLHSTQSDQCKDYTRELALSRTRALNELATILDLSHQEPAEYPSYSASHAESFLYSEHSGKFIVPTPFHKIHEEALRVLSPESISKSRTNMLWTLAFEWFPSAIPDILPSFANESPSVEDSPFIAVDEIVEPTTSPEPFIQDLTIEQIAISRISAITHEIKTRDLASLIADVRSIEIRIVDLPLLGKEFGHSLDAAFNSLTDALTHRAHECHTAHSYHDAGQFYELAAVAEEIHAEIYSSSVSDVGDIFRGSACYWRLRSDDCFYQHALNL